MIEAMQRKIDNTDAEILRLRLILAEDPNDWGLRIMLESLKKRREQLSARIAALRAELA